MIVVNNVLRFIFNRLYYMLTHLTAIGRVHEIETTFIIEYDNYTILDIERYLNNHICRKISKDFLKDELRIYYE